MDMNKCMTRYFILMTVIAVVITLLLASRIPIFLSILMLLVLLVIGWFISDYLCKLQVEDDEEDVATVTVTPTAAPQAVTAPRAAVEAAAEPAPEPEPTPEPTPEISANDGKPELLGEARDGKGDDLKKIKGVGPKLEKELNNAGVFHFDQIAGWSQAEVEWADQNLVSFKGRVSRDNWVDQAKELVK